MSVFYSDTLSVRQYFHLKDPHLWMMVSIITLFLSVAVVTQTLQKAGKEYPLKLCHCITPPTRLVLGELIMCITSLLIDPIQIQN